MACLFVCLFNFAGNPHQSHSIEASWGSFKHSLALFFMTNSVIFQFIQTPDNASSKWHSWGTCLCSHGSSLVQKKSKLWRFICQSWGFLNCHRTGSFLTALEAENGFPARCTRDRETSPGCTLTSADSRLFLEKQSRESLYFFHRNTEQ